MSHFLLLVRKTTNEEGEPRFVIETREIIDPKTMIQCSSEEPLTEPELRKKLAEIGLTPREVQIKIDGAIE